jgi:predicted RNA-binding protein with PUA domain
MTTLAARDYVREAKPPSWFCYQCKVEVYERRCPHCGKLERDKT